MNNERVKILAMIQTARQFMLDQNFQMADAVLQNILHGDINETTVNANSIGVVEFERGFKELVITAGVQACFVRMEPTGIIGQVRLRAGGDSQMVTALQGALARMDV